MSDSSVRVSRPIRYVAAAAVVGAIVGYLREGLVGGALAFAVAIGVGVALGILCFETWQRYVRS